MSVTSVCNSISSSIRTVFKSEPFVSKNYTSTDTSSNTESSATGGRTVLEALIESITKANEAIDKGLLYLFNDLEHSNGEHQNFLVINSLSEIFRNNPSYSFETDTYTEKLEYAYTCGQLYSSYGKASDGTFITNSYGYVTTDVLKVCNTYSEYYNKFTPSISSTSSYSGTSKIVQFWNRYYSSFSQEIQPFIDVFNSMATDWQWFYDEITTYKETGTEAAKLQAVGYTFTSSDNRSELALPTMTDVFSSCETKFQAYDSQVEYFYSLWKKTLNKMEEKTDLDSWDANSEKYKMFTGAILENIGFFTKAKNIYNEFLTFFQKYGIQ